MSNVLSFPRRFRIEATYERFEEYGKQAFVFRMVSPVTKRHLTAIVDQSQAVEFGRYLQEKGFGVDWDRSLHEPGGPFHLRLF